MQLFNLISVSQYPRGFEETEKTMRQIIASGNCSEAGRIRLEFSLAFIDKIVGPHCNGDGYQRINWADHISGDGTCTGEIFKGVKYIYMGYRALEDTPIDCT